MIKKKKHLLHTYLGFHSFVLWVWINNSMKYKQQWDIIDEAPYKTYWSPGRSWSVHCLHASETYQKYRHDQLYTSSDHRGCDMYKNAHTPCLLGASMLNSAALCHLHHGTGQISRLKHKHPDWPSLYTHHRTHPVYLSSYMTKQLCPFFLADAELWLDVWKWF